MKICMFGASSNALDEIYYSEARELGHEIARAGHTLIYGGSDCGLMRSCSDGVLEAGGKLLGIAPKFFNDAGILNRKCDDFIFTETMSERKQKMEDEADAFIAVPGGIGTYDEFFETMTLKQLRIHAKPLALLNTADYFSPLLKMLEDCAAKGFMRPDCLKLFKVCSTPREAVDYIQCAEAAESVGGGLNGYSF
ncbi:MAG: TIGR00730 family Rossman fold protein [Oscillospiraceae bacterium]|nr:TIGR00730 family Rossman fold protein [Oscillospiraceae bacterium]